MIYRLVALFCLIVCLSCASEKDHLVKIQTKHGDMYALFFDETPKHKQNFLDLAKDGRFDSTEFHRIIRDFMVQGGDVFTKEELPANEWPTIQAEIKAGFIHKKGMIAAARQGNNINPERRSNGSQFYIVLGKTYTKDELVTDMKLLSETFFKYIQLTSNAELKKRYSDLYEEKAYDQLNALMLEKKSELESFYSVSLEKKMTSQQIEAYTTVGGTPHLDGEYTVFGEIIQGIEIAEKIAEEEKGNADRPVNPIYMIVTVEEMPKSKITKEFGYEYKGKDD